MDKIPNKFMSVEYQLYTIVDGKKNLQEETGSERPFEFITGFGIALDDQEQALGCKRYIADVLLDEVNSMKDALKFMRDFSFCCDDRSVRDRRVKDKPWKDIYNTFFTILNINPKTSAGKDRPLKTVKTACDMIR